MSDVTRICWSFPRFAPRSRRPHSAFESQRAVHFRKSSATFERISDTFGKFLTLSEALSASFARRRSGRRAAVALDRRGRYVCGAQFVGCEESVTKTSCVKRHEIPSLLTMDMVVASLQNEIQNIPTISQVSSPAQVSPSNGTNTRRMPSLRMVQLPTCPADQGVFQASQSPIFQLHCTQAYQEAGTVASMDGESVKDFEPTKNGQKKREGVFRSSSYKGDQNELAFNTPAFSKDEEDTAASIPLMQAPSSTFQGHSGQYGVTVPGPTVLDYAGNMNQPFFIQGSSMLVHAAAGDMSAYQIHSPTSGLPQGVVMAVSQGSLHSSQQLAEEATRKRELRLMKNREAARECRRKKKEYVKCLENRVAVLENQNKTLIEELKVLKDLYCHKTE
ncbi:cAMP-responsive element modulator isoform X1 [Arapaima gigas]